LRDKSLLLVGIGAGLRCAEICALQLADVYLSEERLVVEEGKGRKQRQIFLAPDVANALKGWIDFRGSQDGPLFVRILRNQTVTRAALSTSGLSHALKTVQETAHIKPFTPHDLRRTFITQLLEQGVDLNTVRQLAGHSDVSTTVRYDKRDEAWQKQASQSFRL
jgi:site-specific recombinase XerD